MSKIQLDICAL